MCAPSLQSDEGGPLWARNHTCALPINKSHLIVLCDILCFVANWISLVRTVGIFGSVFFSCFCHTSGRRKPASYARQIIRLFNTLSLFCFVCFFWVFFLVSCAQVVANILSNEETFRKSKDMIVGIVSSVLQKSICASPT